MADNQDAQTASPASVKVDISLEPLKSAPVALTRDQVCRLLANVGNQVVTWLRYDVGTTNIPVVCSEGTQSWRSEDGECSDIKHE